MTVNDDGHSDGGIGAQLTQIAQEQGKQSTTLAVINTKLDALAGTSGDHETRLRALESAKAKIIGGAVSAGVLSGAVATLVYWALNAHH